MMQIRRISPSLVPHYRASTRRFSMPEPPDDHGRSRTRRLIEPYLHKLKENPTNLFVLKEARDCFSGRLITIGPDPSIRAARLTNKRMDSIFKSHEIFENDPQIVLQQLTSARFVACAVNVNDWVEQLLQSMLIGLGSRDPKKLNYELVEVSSEAFAYLMEGWFILGLTWDKAKRLRLERKESMTEHKIVDPQKIDRVLHATNEFLSTFYPPADWDKAYGKILVNLLRADRAFIGGKEIFGEGD